MNHRRSALELRARAGGGGGGPRPVAPAFDVRPLSSCTTLARMVLCHARADHPAGAGSHRRLLLQLGLQRRDLRVLEPHELLELLYLDLEDVDGLAQLADVQILLGQQLAHPSVLHPHLLHPRLDAPPR